MQITLTIGKNELVEALLSLDYSEQFAVISSLDSSNADCEFTIEIVSNLLNSFKNEFTSEEDVAKIKEFVHWLNKVEI